ncbi:filamentous haemagglutinin family protein [Methylophilus luteus]|uniref:Filamentous hemagglutinin family protein n=1 Tax=Methylophilus luteus TaxID=640108 RepID=A0ABW3F0M9_9PROT
MNKLRFKLVFSKRLGMLVPIAEISRTHQKTVTPAAATTATVEPGAQRPFWKISSGSAALLFAGCLSWLSAPVYAIDPNTVPINGVVVSGAGTINPAGNVVDVITRTNNAVIRWDSFNIGSNAAVNFKMPDASSSVLNRVMGNGASIINGTLTANGHVYIANQNGIYFGAGAQVHVGSLTGLTLDNLANNAVEDIYNRGILANPTAPVFSFADVVGVIDVAKGATIETTRGGRVMLLAPSVTNSGLIRTPDGQTILAAGKTVYLSKVDDFAGLLVEVSSGGTATNLGELIVGSGNASLIGLAVNQSGSIKANTTIRANGSVFLKAKQITQFNTPLTDVYGKVTLGEGSETSVTIDKNDSETVKNAQSILKSKVEITGQDIDIEGKIVANSGVVDVLGKSNVGTTSLFLGEHASIDVSGVDANAPMSRNQLAIQLYSQQLNDSPILRGGALFGQTLYLDARKGTGIISQAVINDALLSQERTLAERMVEGGSISLIANSVVAKSGSVLDTSSGTITYAPGNIRESQLFYNGKWINASDAVAGIAYTGINNQYSIESARWGMTRTWNLSDSSGGRLQAGYTEGGNAGSVRVDADELAFQATVLANVTPGTFQRGDYANVSTPLGGKFTLNYAGTGALNLTSNVNLLGDDFTKDSELSTEQKQLSELNTSILSNGVNRLTINAVAAKVNVLDSLTADPKGALAISAVGGINVNKDIHFAGGTIALSSNPVAPTVVAEGVKISTAGLFTNDLPGTPGAMSSPVAIDGGKITISDGLILKDNAKIDASAGAWIANNGQVKMGHGGDVDVTLAQNHLPQGAITSYGMSNGATQTKGGSLTVNLQGPSGNSGVTQVQLGGVNPQAANTLWLSESFFKSGGFSGYVIDNHNLPLGSILVGDAANSVVTIAPQQATRVLVAGARAQSNNANIAALTNVTTLPDYARAPTSIKLNAGDKFTLNSNASIVTDAPTRSGGATGDVTISSKGQMTILGDIIAPSANIQLAVTGQPGNVNLPNAQFDNTLSLFVGSDATISAKATYTAPPSADGTLKNRQLIDAGKISLKTDNGVLILKEGSKIDVSGTSGLVDLPTATGYTRQQVDANAGTISLAARDGMALDGALTGQASGNGAGGTLNITLGGVDAVGTEGNSNDPLYYPAGQRILTVTQQHEVLSSANLPGSSVNNLIDTSNPQKPLTNAVGKGQISQAQITKGGFDNVGLRVDDVVDNANSGIVFANGLKLNVPSALTLDATAISGGANVTASTIVLTNNNSGVLANPVAANQSLSFNADFIDVIGSVAFTNINELHLNSKSDIRLSGIRSKVINTGTLYTPEKLVMDAAQIYPVTQHTYNLNPTGANTSIEIRNSAHAQSQVPMSAQGTLNLNAQQIVQSGTLRAPLGQINLNASDKIVLSPNSITSVSAEGSLIPFAVTTLGGSRLIPDAGSVQSDIVYNGKKITLNSGTIDIQDNAKVDISGGGDTMAYEWIKGIGGSVDILNQKGYYAVLPGLNNQYAPYDFNMQSSSDVALGQAVYLSGGNGLAAGKYTLLPAHYALLPGAFLVRADGATSQPINTSVALVDGSMSMSGYLTKLDNTSRGQYASFNVVNGNVFYNNANSKDYKGPAEYLTTRGNSFFLKQAQTNNQAVAERPLDAGQLSIQASQQLSLNGQISGKSVAGGKGALVDITSNQIQVVSNLGGAAAGVLQLSADQLSNIEADSILLGGTRQFSDGKYVVTTQASQVVVENDADHAVENQELILTAKDSVQLKTGAVIKTTPSTATKGKVELATSGSGALLAVSANNELVLTRTGASASTGDLSIAAGASVASDYSAVLDSTRSFDKSGDVVLAKNGILTLGSQQFALGTNSPVAGTKIDAATLQAYGQLSSLILNSYQQIDLYGALEFGTPQLNLTLNTTGLAHHGVGDVVVNANTLVLKNTLGNSFTPAVGGGAANLVFNTENTTFGKADQGFNIAGFDQVAFNANQQVKFSESGALNVNAANTTLTSGVVTADTGANYALNASGQLQLASNNKPVAETTGLGAKLTVSSQATTLDGKVELLAGQFKAVSTQGNLVVAENANISTRAATVQFDKQTAKTTNAGDINLVSNTGNVEIRQDALVDVSGGDKSGNAGSVQVEAKQGRLLVADGSLKGQAAAGNKTGSVKLDVAQLDNFSGVNQALESGDFNQSRDIRVRNGNVVIAAGDTVTAQTFTLGVDNGNATIAGHINADGNKGGDVAIYANGLVTLANTAQITARGQQANQSVGDLQTGSGGSVLLSSNSLSTTNAVSAATGAVIDTSGYDAAAHEHKGVDGYDGSVTLRGNRGTTGTANTVNVAFNTTAAIKGASEVRVEGTRSYNTPNFNAANMAGMIADTNSFYNANTGAGNYSATQDGTVVKVLPHIEVRSSNSNSTSDMAVGSDVNLSAFGSLLAGRGGSLTLRSNGNLAMNGSLSDGFTNALNTGVMQSNVQTFSYNLIAGADYSAANLTETVNGVGNFSLASNKLIRTGEGDITIAAGNNIQLDANANIYTLGKTVANLDGFTPPPSTGNARNRNNINATGSYVNYGGNITLLAGQDINAVTSGQTVNEWLSRQGSSTADTSWWIRADQFNQGVGALAGGDVNVKAGGNVSNLGLSSATNAQFDTAGANATNQSLVNGGGDINVAVGGNLTNGIYYSGRGAINIDVDGAVQKVGNTGTVVALQDATATINAGTGAVIETVFNPTLWMQNTNVTTAANLTFFNSYTSNSAFSVSSLAGNLSIGQSNPASLNYNTLFNDTNNSLNAVIVNDMAAVHPGIVNATAFSGGMSVNKMILVPSAKGALNLLANQSIVAPISSDARDNPVAQILMSNADASVLSINTPFTGTPSNNLELFGALKTNNALVSSHANTQNMAVIVSKTGDVNLRGTPPGSITSRGVFGLKTAMPAYISAGNNLTLNASLQHNNPYDISVLKAGNDILMEVNQPLAKIEVNGPGDLIVQAGRDINLGNSAGILSRANNVNPNLPANGANIIMLAGVTDDSLDLEGFVDQYINPEGSGPANLKNSEALGEYRAVVNQAVVNFMQKITQKTLTIEEAMPLFLALDSNKQAPLVFDVFSKEMTFAVKDYVQTVDTGRGDALINRLFPSNYSYNGNISMYQSQVVTERAGNVSILLPGGVLNAGVAADITNLPHGIGVVTERGGYINVYADKGFEVNQSKVKSLYGGDLIAWVNNGDIDAGRGSKTAVSIPERIINIDNQGNVVVEVKGVASGSGLATETYDPDGPGGNQTAPTAGSVYLAAPRGALDAGEAGVKSGGDFFGGGQVIVNGNNISASGSSTIPVADTASLGGALAGVSSTAAGATSAMTESLGNQLGNQEVAPKDLPPIVTVKTIRLED